MNKIETKILNCSAIREAEKNMVFTARLTQRGHLIHNMEDLVRLYNTDDTNQRTGIRQISVMERDLILNMVNTCGI